MKDNTYLSRGKTKEGKEVVGYYVPIAGKLYIIEPKRLPKEYELDLDTLCIHYLGTEITSPPQKCLGIRDCEGELIFEGDDVEYTNEAGYSFVFTVVYCGITCSFKLKDKGKEIYRSFALRKPKDFKIIHPTNKEK
jgi:hypothetical protein